MNRIVHSSNPYSDQKTKHSFLTSLIQSTGDHFMPTVYEFMTLVTERSVPEVEWSKRKAYHSST